MPEVPVGKEYLPSPVLLDPTQLYTGEGKVYAKGLQERQNSLEPIFYGEDLHGRKYVTDGNHRAYNAWLHGTPLWGQRVSRGNFDVTQDPDFRPVSQLKIIE